MGELKHLSTPKKRDNSRSSGERTGKSPNFVHVIGCRRCVQGVEGPGAVRQVLHVVTKLALRRTSLERPTEEGDSPVIER